MTVNLLCHSVERRRTDQVIVEDVQARQSRLFPHPGLFDFDAEESAVTVIYNKLQGAGVTPDVSRLRTMATVQAQMKAEIIEHLFAGLPTSTAQASAPMRRCSTDRMNVQDELGTLRA